MKRHPGAPTIPFRAALVVGAALALLAACSYVPDVVNPLTWFGDDEAVAAESDAAGTEEPFPSLSTVPEAPADAPEPAEFEQIAEGLNADKENAQYTDTALRQADDEVGGTPAEPLVAAAAPEPSVVLAQAEPTPAQPLTSGTVVQPADAAVPAQPLGTTTVVASSSTPVAAAPTAPSASGSVTEMFAAAFRASGATTLAAAGVPAAPVLAPALAQASAEPLPALATVPGRQIATIHFADGSTRIERADEPTLLEVAYAYGATGGPIRIVGHASAGSGSVQSKLANLDVSMGRAVAVAQALTKLGVPADAMTLEAAADNQPVSSGDPASNRRVEIYLGG